jgi:hypothetical protein
MNDGPGGEARARVLSNRGRSTSPTLPKCSPRADRETGRWRRRSDVGHKLFPRPIRSESPQITELAHLQSVSSRGDWIRTSDRPAPSRVRYQTAPLPVVIDSTAHDPGRARRSRPRWPAPREAAPTSDLGGGPPHGRTGRRASLEWQRNPNASPTCSQSSAAFRTVFTRVVLVQQPGLSPPGDNAEVFPDQLLLRQAGDRTRTGSQSLEGSCAALDTSPACCPRMVLSQQVTDPLRTRRSAAAPPPVPRRIRRRDQAVATGRPSCRARRRGSPSRR